jgi:hypothetical protein
MQFHPLLHLFNNPPSPRSSSYTIGKNWTLVIWIFEIYIFVNASKCMWLLFCFIFLHFLIQF